MMNFPCEICRCYGRAENAAYFIDARTNCFELVGFREVKINIDLNCYLNNESSCL